MVGALRRILVDNCIWTYGGLESRLPIPDLISQLATGLDFIGVTGIRSIQGSFVDTLRISYDYNHQNGTHRDLFRIKTIRVLSFEQEGYWARVVQELERDQATLGDLWRNPALFVAPTLYSSTLEYAFPAIVTFRASFSAGELLQVHLMYPETDRQTKTFALVYARFKWPWLKPLLRSPLLKAVNTVVEQDVVAIETLYPRQMPKIRLPNEEIMVHADRLYREWDRVESAI